MPYSTNSELPDRVKSSLPERAQTVFRTVFNAQLATGKSEEVAFASAWAAVKGEVRKAIAKVDPLYKSAPKPLYVSRKLKNGKALIAWAKSQGIETTVPEDELHVTVLYSKRPIDWFLTGNSWGPEVKVPPGGPRTIEKFGEGAIVLRFSSEDLLYRHNSFVEIAGASHDYEDYAPHVTITYQGNDIDLSKIEPFTGELVFGPEIFTEIDEGWKDRLVEKVSIVSDVFKVNDEHRMVYGWASVVTKAGEPVVDIQGDVIKADELVAATTEFMKSVRDAKEMHEGGVIGQVVHSFPITNDIAKSLGLSSENEGWIVGMYVADDAVWDRVKKGELKAFSIGGSATRKELAE